MSAPDRIYLDRGPKGGWMHRDKRMPDTVAEYILLDPNTRVVTVDQLRKWASTVKTYTQDYTIDELGEDLFTLGEIRAIIGDVK